MFPEQLLSGLGLGCHNFYHYFYHYNFYRHTNTVAPIKLHLAAY